LPLALIDPVPNIVAGGARQSPNSAADQRACMPAGTQLQMLL